MSPEKELKTIVGKVHTDDWLKLYSAELQTNEIAGEKVVQLEFVQPRPLPIEGNYHMVEMTVQVGKEALFRRTYKQIQAESKKFANRRAVARASHNIQSK